ncbi:single-stranded-DNA-specific exonuclease RecJ [Natranaerovirga hydrolytica]|uniref:Single-stranded-DNA-specific exonuclease RecJ n=1 Tax=Natranaerovirga hydrolytica TaxID=680378 RepID=A0A4R1MX27_9FIRM|nr:single-stranded-DNA-specific exonuclease RecJ [Natranaerovirga hydrolytica]TCK97797.1 single-stranded-DNA-specific exonuclease RecJ [Natranaerovirga hydrolytica]
MIPQRKIWALREKNANQIKDKKMPQYIAKILENRGITDEEDIQKFLNPTLEQLHDPFLLKDMNQAVARVLKAIDKNEKIYIYGDYDVDGITSTSVLYLFLKNELQGNVSYYIPDRLEEGYGVNVNALKKIRDEGTQLLITVDTGITACEECQYALDIGLDVIITDHHECQDQLPHAIAVIDPKREDCHYPFDKLAGVGVVFKLIQGIALTVDHIDTEDIYKYLDIVAIGTVADIVPLVDENRVITYNAFKKIPNTWNIGLKALLKISDYKEDNKITAGFIGYRLAPRLNAGGRIGDAKRGVALFITDKEEEAYQIAQELNQENAYRQELEEKIYNEAVKIIEKENNLEEEKILVVASENWHHGVIGIVSSRITEKYYRPSLLLCIEDGVATGSARSVEGFSIFEALNRTKDIMNKFGGHDMAAGLSIDEDKIQLLQNNLNAYANEQMTPETLVPKLKADSYINVEEITVNLIEEIQQLEPYGMGNPEPQFILKGAIDEIRLVGKNNNHLRLGLSDNQTKINGIGFGMPNYDKYYKLNDSIELIGQLAINEWNGLRSPQILIKDIRHNLSSINYLLEQYNTYKYQVETDYEQHLEGFLASNNIKTIHREKFEEIYKKLNYNLKVNGGTQSIFDLIQPKTEAFIQLVLILDVFDELGLIQYKMDIPFLEYHLLKNKKVKLDSSKLYKILQQG